MTNKNYMTPSGFSQLQNELRHLLNNERPQVVETVRWAAGNGDRSENGDYIYGKKRLREIDKRARYLVKKLESAEIVDPQRQQHLIQVFFGATVTFEYENGERTTVKLVGVDEADLAKNKINWTSPVAQALLKTKIGDIVKFDLPTGAEEVEVIAIRYEIET